MIADRQGGAAQVIADNLRDLGHCNHERFIKLYHGAECEECGYDALRFAFECVACHTQLCLRCRRGC